VIDNFISGSKIIEPRKNGKKFYSPNWPNSAQETASLYQLCRQTYVDVVGSGLLYSNKYFIFKSPTLMLNYLWVINPVHKDAIANVELTLSFRNGNKTLPSKAFEFLAECKGLRDLTLYMVVDHSNCDTTQYAASPYVIWYEISGKLLAKIREWDALRQIKRLLLFDLIMFVDARAWKGSLPPHRQITGAEGRYRQLEEDLREALLKK
jgi:hypothetical protein